MQVEIRVDSAYSEPKVVILTDSMTDEVSRLVKRITEDSAQALIGHQGDRVEILALADLIRVYANAGKVYAQTPKGEYVLRMRLYEAESRLPADQFIRISNSELIHIQHVAHFDLSLSGTICVHFNNGATTYVSRRYVPKLKTFLER